DRGTTTSHYNGFGLRTSSTDEQMRRIKYFHDPLGRLVARTDNDGTTTWEWDTASHGIGKIKTVTSPDGHMEKTAYDPYSRPVATYLAIDSESFAMEFDYDPQGRLSTITYPEADNTTFAVKNAYDPYGHLLAVEDVATQAKYWALTATDGAGRITGEKLGTEVTTTWDYYPDRDRVKSIVTANTAAEMLQNLSYHYDEKQNLTDRVDTRQKRTESFQYDALDRLTCTSLDNLPGCREKYTYAANGNIDWSQSAGKYTYDPAHPHAVQAVGSDIYGYDPTGNQITRPDATITYTAFDMPRTFTRATGTVTLDYDGDQNRIRKSASGATGDIVTVYFGDRYERVTDTGTGLVEHRYYVYAGERLVAIVTRPEGA